MATPPTALPPARPTPRGLAIAALAWTVYAVAYAGAIAAFAGVAFGDALWSQAVYTALVAVLGGGVWWAVARRLAELPAWRVVAAHVAGAALYVPAVLALSAAVVWAMSPEGARAMLSQAGWIGVGTAVLYFAQAGVYHAVEASRRGRARREQAEALRRLARDQELRTLRAQLNPHFLFNALNTISAEVGRDPDAAREAIGRLGALMRYALDAGRADLVPLGRELRFVRDYLALEGARMGDRLEARVELDAEAETARVPPMAVQTLVENAVRHGLAPSRAGGALVVSARRRGDAVEVSVEDTGVGATGTASPSGIGLANTDERLRLLFGDAAALRVDAERPVGFAVAFRVPAEPALDAPPGPALDATPALAADAR